MTELKIAWRFIVKSPWQSLLLILTITLGISSQFFIISLAKSIDNLVVDMSIDQNQHIFIQTNSKYSPKITEENNNDIKAIEQVKYTTVFGVVDFLVSKDGEYLPALMAYVSDDEMFNVIQAEKNLQAGRVPESENEILISSEYAREFNIKVDDVLVLKQTTTLTVTVVGIYKDPSYNPRTVYYGFIANSAYNSRSQMYITLYDINDLEEVLPLTKEIISTNYYTFRDLFTRFNTLKVLREAEVVVLGVIQGFISIAIFLVSSSIFSYFVNQKTNQIGVLKALGYSNKRVGGSLYLVTIILGTVSVVLGLFISDIALKVYQNIMTNPDGTFKIKVVSNISFYVMAIFLVYFSISISTFIKIRSTKKQSIIKSIRSI